MLSFSCKVRLQKSCLFSLVSGKLALRTQTTSYRKKETETEAALHPGRNPNHKAKAQKIEDVTQKEHERDRQEKERDTH